MNEHDIIDYIKAHLDGVDVVLASRETGAPEVAWGDAFFIYDPERRLNGAQQFPFATLVTKDYGDFDRASQLDRPGVFRLNIQASKNTFDALFGDKGVHDFTALDTLMPHPVYGAQRWVCILNPGADTFQNVVRPLLVDAHESAKARYGRARVTP